MIGWPPGAEIGGTTLKLKLGSGAEAAAGAAPAARADAADGASAATATRSAITRRKDLPDGRRRGGTTGGQGVDGDIRGHLSGGGQRIGPLVDIGRYERPRRSR